MIGLKGYVGRQFKDLEPMGETFARPSDFGERKITEQDVIDAFPESLIGLFNTAATRYGLVSAEEIDSMRDTS